jgi:thiamine biosynthesis lipoprotein
MTQPREDIGIVTSDWDSIEGLHRYSHEAMAATFEIIISHEDKRYAQQAAQAAFDMLDQFDQDLSRFIENSDISRINNLSAGQPLQVCLDTFECLQFCRRKHAETKGVFDITVGSLLKCLLNKDKTLRNPSEQELNRARQRTGMDLLRLNKADYTVELLTDGVQIDLGGIGKGYVVDKMAELLDEWSIDVALLNGGYSSVLALGALKGTKGWPVTLSSPRNRKQTLARLVLANRAVSGSGLQRGRHIVDPRTARPVEAKSATWACAPNAATTDALSTSFMIMSPDEVKLYCSRHKDISAMLVMSQWGKEPPQEKILTFGSWKKGELLF